MAKKAKSDLQLFSEEYVKDVQELTSFLTHKYPTLNVQQHTMMANDIRKTYAVERHLRNISESADGVYEHIINEDLDNSRDCIGTKQSSNR